MKFSLKPKEIKLEYKIPDVHFELIVADFDTPLYKAAKSVQEDYIVVTFKRKGTPGGVTDDAFFSKWKKIGGHWTTEFQNKTEFHGHWKAKKSGWLSGFNADRLEEGFPELTADDFDIQECSRLSKEIDNHLEEAITQFDFSVGRLKRVVSHDDYMLCIGGEDNFRYDIAKILPYKGERKEKPILFQEVKEAIIKKYKSKIKVVDGEEADDFLGQVGWKNYINCKKTGEWKYCLAYIDKDLDMIISPSFNYDDTEPKIKYTTEFEAAFAFCGQLLSGDKGTDNIQGLPKFTKEIVEKYSLRKNRGIGKASAVEYLNGCDCVKELFERVVEAYRDYYGDSYKFISCDGEELDWSWLDFLKENAILLWMRRNTNEIYDIENTLKMLEIDYE